MSFHYKLLQQWKKFQETRAFTHWKTGSTGLWSLREDKQRSPAFWSLQVKAWKQFLGCKMRRGKPDGNQKSHWVEETVVRLWEQGGRLNYTGWISGVNAQKAQTHSTDQSILWLTNNVGMHMVNHHHVGGGGHEKAYVGGVGRGNPRALTGLEVVCVLIGRTERLHSTQDCFLRTFNFNTKDIFKCVFKAVKNTGTASSLVPRPWSVLRCQKFTHHCFCSISTNVNSVKKANKMSLL